MNAINPVTKTEFLESLAAISLADVLKHFDVHFPTESGTADTAPPLPEPPRNLAESAADETEGESSYIHNDDPADEVSAAGDLVSPEVAPPEIVNNVVAFVRAGEVSPVAEIEPVDAGPIYDGEFDGMGNRLDGNPADAPEVAESDSAPEVAAADPEPLPPVVTTLRMTCDRQALAKATATALKAVEKRNTIPVLSNVLIEADGAGSIIVEGTDLDMKVRVVIPAECDPDFAITVPAHRLHDLLKKAGPGEVSFAVDKTTFPRVTDPAVQRTGAEAAGYSVHEVGDVWKVRLPNGNYLAPVDTEEAAWQLADNDRTAANYGPATLTLGSFIKTTLQTESPADYPHLKAGEFPVTFDVSAMTLADAFKAVDFAISNEETRYYLNGVYWHTFTRLGAPVLRMVATDGHRLAQFDQTGLALPTNALPQDKGAIVPRKMIAVARALFGGKPPRAKKGEPASDLATVKVEFSDTKVRMSSSNVVITSKLIDGTYPDYQRVIPSGNDKVMRADAGELAAAVARVTTVSSERGRAVKMALSDDRLVLSVNNPDCGAITEEMRVDYGSDPVEIGFNASYLLDMIAGRKGTITFRLADPGSPTLIEPSDDKRASYVFMPMRV